MSAALHLKPWTDARRTLAMEHTGKKAKQLAGSYISDLASLRKAISLCLGCFRKFDARASGYMTDRTIPRVVGRCDGCKEHGSGLHLLVHHKSMPRL